MSNIKQSIKKIQKHIFLLVNHALDFIYPPLCVVCQERLMNQEEHICLQCVFDLPYIYTQSARRKEIEEKLTGSFLFEKVYPLCDFDNTASIRQVVHAIKYNGNKKLANFMGSLCAKLMLNELQNAQIDYLIPIPLHPKRLRSRGFNQAEEIAKGVSATTNIPVNTESFRRAVNNVSQTKLSKEKRQKNVANIFQLTDLVDLENKHILLIDDIITTGATLSSLISTLPKEKNIKISILALGAAR